MIVKPTTAGQSYDVVANFKGEQKGGLIFDMGLYDREGELCEAITELLMKEIGKL